MSPRRCHQHHAVTYPGPSSSTSSSHHRYWQPDFRPQPQRYWNRAGHYSPTKLLLDPCRCCAEFPQVFAILHSSYESQFRQTPRNIRASLLICSGKKKGTVSDAVLNSPTSAGQFNIVSGQLVQLINTSGTLLYAHVTLRADSTVNRLLITWGATPDTYGTFGFQGSLWTASSL